MAGPVCALVGAGPGLGEALARRFAQGGYRLALIARNSDRLGALTRTLDGSRAYPGDITREAEVAEIFTRIRDEMGPVETLIYSVGRMVGGDVQSLPTGAFEAAWRLAAFGAFLASRAVLPNMIETGQGTILIIGATASLRGNAQTAAFAPAKAAQRALAQSMARAYGPNGIHVAHVVIDAVVDGPEARLRLPDRAADAFAGPEAIADAVWATAQQGRRAWSFELDLRPYCETW